MSEKQIKKIISEFAEVLKKNRFAFKQIWLFGSYAKGKATEDSDIDIAVVANRLPRGRDYLDKKMRLLELTLHTDSRVEPILLEESDLKEKTASIMGYEVKRHGILVVSG
ncbi:nucleotidyltransferase domain-containing protein [Candidatus Peregrinibacteria bacterium]|nr:nucleotidyltransferase domain-containing protein [Candidatus Peregrinibacteria bacterium]